MGKADSEGLTARNYLPAGLDSFSASLNEIESDLGEIAKLDINLTAMAVRYGQNASGGQIVPNRLSGYHDLKPPKVPAVKILSNLITAQSPAAYLASLHPQHKSYLAFKRELEKLNGGPQEKRFPYIATSGMLKPGMNDVRIGYIRERLKEAGFLQISQPDAAPLDINFYDDNLVAAVRNY